MTFDISQFEASKTAVLDVMDKTGASPLMNDGKPVQIVMYGPGTEESVRAEQAVAQAATARVFATMRGKPSKESPEELRKQAAQKLAAVTKELVNFPIEPIALYMNPALGYITQQAEKFQQDWGNF